MDTSTNKNEIYDKHIEESITELERRINITRRARFLCASRLREYYNKIQNLIVYYNIMVVIISVISLYQLYNDKAGWITYVTLSLSISLSFFATHIGGKNYKERAIMMETNSHDLSRIYGKIEMIKLEGKMNNEKKMNADGVTNLYKEYERVLENVENHDSIDFLHVKRSKGQALEIDLKAIKNYHVNEKRLFTFAYLAPVVIAVIMLVLPIIM